MLSQSAMHKAFWANLSEGLLSSPPRSEAAARLVSELREELLQIAPASWSSDLNERLALRDAELTEVGEVERFASLSASGYIDETQLYSCRKGRQFPGLDHQPQGPCFTMPRCLPRLCSPPSPLHYSPLSDPPKR